MSDLQTKIDELTKENEALKLQAVQNSVGVENLLCQIDAHKGMLNENFHVGLNLRTNILMLQKQNKQVVEHANDLQKQLSASQAKIVELESSAPAA